MAVKKTSRYFDGKERRSQEQRRADQAGELAAMMRLAVRKSPAVRRLIEPFGIAPTRRNAFELLKGLPVISRERLVQMEIEDPPYAGLGNPDAMVDRIFTSPGPVYEPHLSEAEPIWARAYRAAGFGPGDVVLNAFSYHLVAAGLTFHSGLRRVGATVVPSGASSAAVQVQLIRDLKVTGYTGTPSFLKAVIGRAEEEGHDFRKDFRLRRASFAAEPLLPSLRAEFEGTYGIDTYQMYGATEVGDVAYECREKNGWHLGEEVIVEIVDPETGREVKPGELGEVVVTRINTILFLFRFGTGDLSRLITGRCPCGRTTPRLAGIAGRVGEAVKVRGLFVAPSQLRKIAESFPGLKFQAVVTRVDNRDCLTVRIETQDAERGKEALAPFQEHFAEICTVRIDRFEEVPPGTLPEGGKPIVDGRSWT
ncbi:MAG TPA: AMP-binding protein [Syntrophales bacterium]|nr:AMP-binding protein [Syntrophales bacterium]